MVVRMENFQTQNTNNLNVNLKKRNKGRYHFECSNSFKNKDYIKKTVFSDILGSLKQSVTNITELKNDTVLVRTTELNRSLNSIILPLLILILILNIQGKISEQKFIDTNDKDSISEKTFVKNSEQKRSPCRRIRNKVSSEFEQRCNRYIKKLEELQYGVFTKRKHVDKLVQELMDNYNSMKNQIPKISLEEIETFGKFAKVLTLYNKPNVNRIVQKISHISYQYYILISILKDWKMAETESDKIQYRKEFQALLKNTRLEDFNAAMAINRMSEKFFNSIENKNRLDKEKEFIKEKSYAFCISQIASNYSDLLEDLKECTNKEKKKQLLDKLYSADYYLVKHASKFMNI